VREILPPEKNHFEKYYRYERCFSVPECEKLIELAEGQGMHPGSIGNGANSIPVINPEYRQVLTSRITPEMAPWLFERLIERVQWVNQEYQFDLHGLFEDVGIMRYDGGDGSVPPGHYNWHQDFGGGPYSRRKISIVSLLSDPAMFSGGTLRMFNESDEVANLSMRGDTVLFPSWTPHCVSPVLAGRRYSLVAWVSGARFK
jgi:PKHD-type hydroxylase